MTKVMKVASVLGGIMLMLPIAASAATTQTFLALDGQTTATIGAGDSVDGVLTFNLTGNSTVQSVKVEVPNSGFAGACINVEPNQNSTGTHTVALPISTVGATEGTYDVKLTAYGIQSNQTGANNNCDGTIGVSNAHTFTNVLTLTAQQSSGGNANNTGGGSSSGGTGTSVPAGTQAAIDALKAQIAALIAQISGLTGVVAAMAPDAICMQLPTGVAFGSHGAAGLQTFLIQNSESIGYGATGYFGVQTQAALDHFKTVHKCH
jgi:hypothetical protein